MPTYTQANDYTVDVQFTAAEIQAAMDRNPFQDDPIIRAAQLWTAMVADATRVPHRYPALREELILWFRDQAAKNRS